MYILLALFAGGTIVTSRNINAMLGEKIGVLRGTFFNYLIGFFVSSLVLLLSKETILPLIFPNSFPDYIMYLGGIIGIVAIVIANYITPKLSAFSMTLLVFISQLLTGIILDYFLYHEFSLSKVLGGAFVLLGLSYNLYQDKKEVLKKA